MKKILFLIVLFAAVPFLAQSEEGIKVQTNGGSIEVKTGSPSPPPNPQVIVVRPVERTTVVQPAGNSGCGLLLGL